MGFMREFFGNLRHFLSARLWAWPILTAAVGIVASLVLHDVRISGDVPWARFLWPGDASAASDMLSFISSTTLTVLTTTISMTLIVLQVASGNFSHQLLRDFIESRAVRGILAVYVGVVAYSLTLQRSIDADSEFVPQLAMTVSMILIAVSLATFIWYVSRVVDMVRGGDAIIDGTVRQTLANIDERIDAADCGREPRPVVPAGAQLLTSNDHGFVQGVDIAAAERWARKFNAVVVIDARPGDFIVQGQTGAAGGPPTAAAISAGPPRLLRLDAERVSGVDFTLGIRQLLDIVVRSLGSGVNDTTAATHAIGQLATVIRQMALTPVPPTVRYRDGQVAVWAASHTVGEVLRDITTETRTYGAHSIGVVLQLLRLLDIAKETVDDPGAALVGTRSDAEGRTPGVDRATRLDLLRFIAEERRRIVAAAERDIPEQHDVTRAVEAAYRRDAMNEPPPEPGA